MDRLYLRLRPNSSRCVFCQVNSRQLSGTKINANSTIKQTSNATTTTSLVEASDASSKNCIELYDGTKNYRSSWPSFNKLFESSYLKPNDPRNEKLYTPSDWFSFAKSLFTHYQTETKKLNIDLRRKKDDPELESIFSSFPLPSLSIVPHHLLASSSNLSTHSAKSSYQLRSLESPIIYNKYFEEFQAIIRTKSLPRLLAWLVTKELSWDQLEKLSIDFTYNYASNAKVDDFALYKMIYELGHLDHPEYESSKCRSLLYTLFTHGLKSKPIFNSLSHQAHILNSLATLDTKLMYHLLEYLIIELFLSRASNDLYIIKSLLKNNFILSERHALRCCNIFQSQGSDDDAIDTLKLSLNYDFRNLRVRSQLFKIYIELNRYNDAFRLLQDTTSIDSNDSLRQPFFEDLIKYYKKRNIELADYIRLIRYSIRSV